jgi:hypothetical protein
MPNVSASLTKRLNKAATYAASAICSSVTRYAARAIVPTNSSNRRSRGSSRGVEVAVAERFRHTLELCALQLQEPRVGPLQPQRGTGSSSGTCASADAYDMTSWVAHLHVSSSAIRA